MSRYQGLVGPALIGSVIVAGYFLINRSESATRNGPPGWEELILCSELTSIDSKKSLSLDHDFSAKLVDRTGPGKPKSAEGRWSLLNAGYHSYQIDTPGAVGVYVVVSPPESEGCVLAAGSIDSANLWRSWFSVQIEQTPD